MKQRLFCRLLFTLVCAVKGPDRLLLVELPGDDPAGANRVFPYRQARACASGEFDHFTIRRLEGLGLRANL